MEFLGEPGREEEEDEDEEEEEEEKPESADVSAKPSKSRMPLIGTSASSTVVLSSE